MSDRSAGTLVEYFDALVYGLDAGEREEVKRHLIACPHGIDTRGLPADHLTRAAEYANRAVSALATEQAQLARTVLIEAGNYFRAVDGDSGAS